MSSDVRLIIIVSGKRKSGKDYVATELQKRIGADTCSILRLSEPLKQQYAEINKLDHKRLLDATEYKEKYRADMIKWGEEKRLKDYGYFCRLATSGPGCERPVWIVSDARRQSDFKYFNENYSGKLLSLRVVASDDVRKDRGWIFQPGVDDAPSECDLDTGVTFDVVIDNSSHGDLDKQLTSLTDFIKCRI